MSAERALAAAVRDAALADASVTALLANRFFDEPPDDVIFPYATIGRVESKPSGEALEHAVTLHVWSRYGGRAEAIDCIGALREALHDAPLSVEGRRCVFIYASFADVFRAGDGRTSHGVLRLRALTEAS